MCLASMLVALVAGCCPPGKAAVVAPTPPPAEPAPPQPPPVVAEDDGVPWETSGVDWTRPPPAAAEAAYAPPVAEEFTLRNGARVILVENRRLPLVSVAVQIDGAGSTSGAPGLASLVTDLIVEGAGSYTALTLPEALEELGAELGAGAGADHAQLGLDVLAEQLPPALALLGDVIRRPRMADADFKRVKADALEALTQRRDNPRAVAELVFDRALFAGTPYAEPVEGDVASVSKLTLAQVKAFWKARYRPKAATILVAGAVDRATLEPLLETALKGWSGAAPAPAAIKAPTPPSTPTIYVVDRPDAPQSVVVIGGPGPRRDDDAYDARELINTALGGTFASRLNSRLREELGYTYGVSSGFWRARGAGAWAIRSSIRTDVTVAALKEALAIVERTAAKGLDADEFAKTAGYLVRQLPLGFETNDAIVASFADLVVRGRPLDDYARYAARVRAVTPEEATRSIATIWRDLHVVVVGDWDQLRYMLTTLRLPIVHLDADGRPTTR
ncbi:MAG: pitrilysin family protein [Kofleriaceae bacterium]